MTSKFPIHEPTPTEVQTLRNNRECGLTEARTILHRQALAESYQDIMKNGSQSDKIDWLMERMPEILRF